MEEIKNIGLVAHDAKKKDLAEWVRFNASKLARHRLTCTGTTGAMVAAVLRDYPWATVRSLRSGPLGGDQQMGALIASGAIDILIFFTDPMTLQPHDVDVRALERLCAVENTVLALTRATADFVISSPLFHEDYTPVQPDYQGYLSRLVHQAD